MKLKLVRKFKGTSYTIGDLYIDGELFCNVVEDVVRDLPDTCPNTPKGIDCKCPQKVHSQTAIPEGTYKVVLSMSSRFKKIMPEILNVPHFRGIRIHSGNKSTDTEGCLIVGKNTIVGQVTESRVTFNKLMALLNTDKDDLTIEIS